MKKKRILVVDDELDLTFFLKSNLELSGDYQVFTAADGEEGLRAASEHKPDLIILDIVMPKMDGFEALRRLKQSEDTRETPVIMLTARAESSNLEKSISLGVDFFLPKPFSIDNLTRFIELTTGDKAG
jgi:CheY-like chemotaxis protein